MKKKELITEFDNIKREEKLFFYLFSYFLYYGEGYYPYEKLAKEMEVSIKSITTTVDIIDTLTIVILSPGGEGVFVRFPSYFLKVDITEIMNEVVLVAKKNFPSLWNLAEKRDKFKPFSLPLN